VIRKFAGTKVNMLKLLLMLCVDIIAFQIPDWVVSDLVFIKSHLEIVYLLELQHEIFFLF